MAPVSISIQLIHAHTERIASRHSLDALPPGTPPGQGNGPTLPVAALVAIIVVAILLATVLGVLLYRRNRGK